jgi:hypothetical protein
MTKQNSYHTEESLSMFGKKVPDTWENFCKDFGPKIDSLNIVNYARDTVYIATVSVSSAFFQPSDVIIIASNGKFIARRNPSDKRAILTPITYLSNRVIEAISTWNADGLCDIIAHREGIVVQSMDKYAYAWRIIIDDHKKIETSVLKFTRPAIIETADGPKSVAELWGR